MTADYIALHAAERPNAVAVIHNGRAVSFAEFSADIGKVIAAVRALGVSPGGAIAVGTSDLYLHWLLLLASERLGIAAASLMESESREAASLLAVVDLVLAAPGFFVQGAKRYHALTPSWLDEARARADGPLAPLPAKGPEDPVRIVRTSGTTGESKCFLVTRGMHDALSAQWQSGFRLDRQSRYLQTLAFRVRATYDLGSACLRAGGTVLLERRMSALEVMARQEFTHVILLPVFLKALLDRLPASFPKPRDLTIVAFGAALSEGLRNKATERLATVVCDLYGTVEIGIVSGISQPGEDGFGTLWPQVEAEAVDEEHRPVPPGEVGRIRFKAPYMSQSYIDDPETTARMFRDGWFYPGDVGRVRAERQLQILGRVDDLINIGGLKIWPSVLEDTLLEHAVAGDVGVGSTTGADGMETVCIAVSQVSLGNKELMDRITRALRRVGVGPFDVVTLDRIPRADNGKLQRRALREELVRRLGKK